jgi:hypothetical protein
MNVIVAIVLAQALNLNQQPDKPATGAFGAALSVPETVSIMLSFPYNHLDPIQVITATDAGSGQTSIAADGGHVILTTGTTGYAEMRSRTSARYIPGQGMTTRFTFVSSGCKPGQQFEVGAGDDTDGFAFGCCSSCGLDAGPSFGVLRKTNGVDNWVPVARWNGEWGRVPPDIAYGRPYQIAWQWLGYGQITYSIEDARTGGFVVAHRIKYAGTATETSISNPTLPLHAHVVNVGSDAGQTLRVPSMAMIRQGEESGLGVRRSFQAARTVSTTETEVWALRNDSTFNGRVNRSLVRLDLLTASNAGTGSQDVILRFRLNAVQAGTGFAQVSQWSIASYDTDGGFVSNGTEVLSVVVAATNQLALDLTQLRMHLAPGDVMTVTAQAVSGTPSVRISLTWTEEL